MIFPPRGLARWELTDHTGVGSEASRWWGKDYTQNLTEPTLGAQTKLSQDKISLCF